MGGKKKHKKRNQQPKKPRQLVRLSQCMIVKNEERNIEKALGWAKDIAFEQIVVDTGSTDRTVELAEKLGATVYHFEWIDDFAAAKNFAIDQAKGNWIAFLDADEYMTQEDAIDLMGLLEQIQGDPAILNEHDAITCSWVQLDDEGKSNGVFKQERVFKNRADIRYKGRIHELLQIKNKLVGAEDISIMHTGYAREYYIKEGKGERNIKLLREELERDPGNPEYMIYLADSLKATLKEENLTEAEGHYLAALESDREIHPFIKRLAYEFLIPRLAVDSDRREDGRRLCIEAAEQYPENIDFFYYLAVFQNMDRDFDAALENLRKCETALNGPVLPQSRTMISSRINLYFQMLTAAKGLSNVQEIVKYSTLILREDKYQQGILSPLIVTLLSNSVSEDEVVELLQKLYDLGSVKDKLFIARAAKDGGAIGLAQKVMSMITAEEQQQISGGKD